MKQHDFFRLFSAKMQGTSPPPDFSGEDWSALSARLDAHERKRTRVVPMGWLLGLTGLLLLSNLGWFLAWEKTDESIAAIKTAQLAVAAAPITHRDTSFEQVVVYQYDTIYRTVVVKRMVGGFYAQTGHVPKQFDSNFFTERNSSKTAQKFSPPNTSATGFDPENPSSETLEEGSQGFYEVKNQAEKFSRQSDAAELACLEIEPFPWKKRPVLPATDDLPMKPAQQTTAFPLVPRSFTLSGFAGGFKPGGRAIATSSGFQTGLSGEIGFSDRLSLTVDGSYGNMSFRGYVEDKSLGLPAFQSPGDEYDLKYFETHDERKNLLQLGLGMRWYFSAKTKLTPWLGLAWTTQWNPAYELEVEYVNRNNGMEKSREVSVPATLKPLNYAGLSLGLRYRLGSNWQLLAGGSMDFKLGSQAGIGRWGAWRGGVGYRF